MSPLYEIFLLVKLNSIIILTIVKGLQYMNVFFQSIKQFKTLKELTL